jgi:hypothetical protein
MYEDDELGLWISTLNTRCRKGVQKSCGKAEVCDPGSNLCFENADYNIVTST